MERGDGRPPRAEVHDVAAGAKELGLQQLTFAVAAIYSSVASPLVVGHVASWARDRVRRCDGAVQRRAGAVDRIDRQRRGAAARHARVAAAPADGVMEAVGA